MTGNVEYMWHVKSQSYIYIDWVEVPVSAQNLFFVVFLGDRMECLFLGNSYVIPIELKYFGSYCHWESVKISY